MVKVFLIGTTEELFQLNMSPIPSAGDELVLEDESYLVTGRRFVIESTKRNTKNLDYTILFVRKA